MLDAARGMNRVDAIGIAALLRLMVEAPSRKLRQFLILAALLQAAAHAGFWGVAATRRRDAQCANVPDQAAEGAPA